MEYKNYQFLNRELSWLRFNFHVLDEGKRKSNPLLERLQFLAIAAKNLDEFFEVRVASLEQKIDYGIEKVKYTSLNANSLLKRIHKIVSCMIKEINETWFNEIIPELEYNGFCIKKYDELEDAQKKYIDKFFTEEVYPIITPIKIDPSHPLPFIINKALYITVSLYYKNSSKNQLGIIIIPRVLPRVIKIPIKNKNSKNTFILLNEVIKNYIKNIFKGYSIKYSSSFRITRNSNLYLNEEAVSDLLKAIETEIYNRKRGDVVRMEIQENTPENFILKLQKLMNIESHNIQKVKGPVNFHRLISLYPMIDKHNLKYEIFHPMDSKNLKESTDIFQSLKKKDILLHHPYDSFRPVVSFIQSATADPKVLAIKVTLYRTMNESSILRWLIEAARKGKEVTVLVELKARFDEESNIQLAKNLLENGVNVVYGTLGLKTHCKLILIIRKEENKIVKYAHVGTGNYNEKTAKLYTDLSLLTANKLITKDILNVFNMLTTQTKQPSFQHILVAPYFLKKKLLEMIENEIENAKKKKKAQIIFKVNNLEDEDIIKALYRASENGVKIIGIVRSICCLRPDRKKYSQNITIISIVGRFLEHSRIFYFQNGNPYRVYIGSADLMSRNMELRVEVLVPILSASIEDQIINGILKIYLKDNWNSRINFKKPVAVIENHNNIENYFSSQDFFMKKAMEEK